MSDFLSEHIIVISVDVPPPPVLRHEPNEECNGRPLGPRCIECNTRLCSCEHGYGHDCEEQ